MFLYPDGKILFGHAQDSKQNFMVTPIWGHLRYTYSHIHKLLSLLEVQSQMRICNLLYLLAWFSLQDPVQQSNRCFSLHYCYTYVFLISHVVYFNAHAEKIMSRCTQTQTVFTSFAAFTVACMAPFITSVLSGGREYFKSTIRSS